MGGWLSVSEVQSIVVMAGSMVVRGQMTLEEWLRALLPSGNKKLAETPASILSIGNFKAHPHSDTSPNKATPTPVKSHLVVPFLMRLWGPVTFKL